MRTQRLTLADVRARAAAHTGGGVWVVIGRCRYQPSVDLVVLHACLDGAMREVEEELAAEWRDHPTEEATAEEVDTAAWEITLGAVILRLEWATVTSRGEGTER